MSRYTRFPNKEARYDTAFPRGLEDQPTDAERLFRFRHARPLTREERKTQTAKRIVLEDAERRRTLSEALRAARLERAGRFTESARNKREWKPDQ